MKRKDVHELVQAAYESARAKTNRTEQQESMTPQARNRNRSKEFVEALGEGFRERYVGRKSVAVLTKHYETPIQRRRFGMNELLYDVLVCDTAQVDSATKKEKLTYVTKGLWLVESEFARDSRQAIYDFNKLVLGRGENLLFIGPQTNDPEAFLAPLAAAAEACTTPLYVSLVPHPNDWGLKGRQVRTWEFKNGWHSV